VDRIEEEFQMIMDIKYCSLGTQLPLKLAAIQKYFKFDMVW